MADRGLSADHVTIWRWVQRYAPVLNERIRRGMRHPNRSWRVDETYIKVAGNWAYLYRAVDSAGETIEFMLSPKRDLIAAKLFLRLALSGGGQDPRVINVDGHPAYASAGVELKHTDELGRRCRCRTAPYLTTSSSRTIASSRSGLSRAWDSDRWRALLERLRATRRCMQSAKVRSAGFPRAMPSRNASSSMPSSASRPSFPGACKRSPLRARYLQQNPLSSQ